MGFSETDSTKCRRHPNQRQVPGVCSSCLREKLSKLNDSPSFNRRSTHFVMSYSSSASSSPPYSTVSSSSTTAAATATTRKIAGARHRRNGSEGYVSVGMVLNNGLKKSRSVSCAPLSKSKLNNNNNGANSDCISNEKVTTGKNKNFVDCIGGQILEEENSRKKNGFLKKLIHSTGKKTKGVLTHSKTLNQRSHTSTDTTATSKNKN